MKAAIYIIEDEALVAEGLKRSLTKLGYRVVGIAYDGASAIPEVATHGPDLILSDIRMRGEIDGIEAIRQIKLRHQVAVVFVTAHSDVETLKRAQQVEPQGYLLKPIENPDLEIAIEMALDKHRRERELIESRHLLNTALACIGNAVVFIGKDGAVINLNREACELFNCSKEAAIGRNWSSVIRTVSRQAAQRVAAMVERVITTHAVSRLFPLQISGFDDRLEIVDGIVGPIRPDGREVVGLVMMLRQLARLSAAAKAALASDKSLLAAPELVRTKPFSLLLINPDNLEAINARHGQNAGNVVLQETGELINQALRLVDLATRYGGAVFAASLPNTGLAEARLMADKIHRQLTEYRFLGGRAELSFSIGVAEAEPPADREAPDLPVELFRRASWALNAAREAGGGRIVTWNPLANHQFAGDLDRKSGKFTAHSSDDYRDLMLLWHTVRVVSHTHDVGALATQIVTRLQPAFDLTLTALFVRTPAGRLELAAASRGGNVHQDATTLKLPARMERSMLEAVSSGERRVFSFDGEGDSPYYALPLIVGDRPLGLLLLRRGPGQPAFASDQVEFLETLSEYLAMALDRALVLADRRQQIDTELRDFKQTVNQNELIYESSAMAQLMDELRLVAPTEASVLIVGESGTGKELLAQTIHAVSSRREQTLVIVDCSTIVPQLMESELFGHRKGAFTGAARDSAGKVEQADNGTLFLDEIGELPMELQTKLLRFVQEGSYTPVGATKTRRIDTRLIVATNRDLAAEVHAGRFRSDLFYRLNVFKLECPPLRERDDDVILIARYFLRQFAGEYQTRLTELSPAAESALRAHHWPGNVRELRNTILRAAILCKGALIEPRHLGLVEGQADEEAVADELPPAAPAPSASGSAELPLREPEPISTDEVPDDPVAALRARVDRLVHACVHEHRDNVGGWLEDLCIRLAFQHAGAVANRAAALLGIPESTFRRKLARAEESEDRSAELDPSGRISRALKRLLSNEVDAIDNVLNFIRDQLGSAVVELGLSRARGAALMGVSEPTFRKWIRERRPG